MKRNLANEALLTPEMLWNLFRYEDGKLYWIVRPSYNVDISKPAGSVNKSTRYVNIIIKNKPYLRHRLIFFMHKRFWPEETDHKDLNRSNDRIENLVASNRRENQKNRTPLGKNQWKHISVFNDKACKQGKFYQFSLNLNGKIKHIKGSVSLQKLLAFRNEYLKKYHPDRWEICQRHGC